MTEHHIIIAATDEEVAACYPVMAELRPQISADEFVERIKHQTQIADYRLACLIDSEVKAVAGYRISQNLAWGNFLYVDDLVSKSSDRSKGYGGALFDWLVAHARENGCDQFHLDSGVQRFEAHRFYLTKRMAIEAHHFGLKLS
ncbi:MAG TPA: GNAT family N-acetyltransferase [Pyrinomonadaceae bacterium]|nr:GNAT family N-acetyltransferase [Pyrinomonadaceae bacterium]